LIINKTGRAADDLYVNGFTWSPTYLIAAKTAILFEAGFSCMGKLYEKDIKKVLSNQMPEFLFLTHVHYDHCGAASYFKKIFPNLKICASQRACEIIQRENAVSLMSSLSQYVIPLIAQLPGIQKEELLMEPFQPFNIDIVFYEEQVVNIDDGLSVRVFTTPGHTRDMLSYYIPERKILIATESAGCLGRDGHIVSEFLVDYDAYIKTLKHFSLLDIEIFCQGHHFVFTGEDVQDYFTNSLQAAESFKKHVDELLSREGGSIDNVVNAIKTEEYDSNPGIKQPERAYLLNLKTQVTHLATKLYGQ
jgi:2-aminobenzoylacetyl-CoA thioesterase